MTTAVRRVNEAKQRAVGMLKSDRFLADANWDYVDKKTEIDDPYRFQDDNFEVSLRKDYVLLTHKGCTANTTQGHDVITYFLLIASTPNADCISLPTAFVG